MKRFLCLTTVVTLLASTLPAYAGKVVVPGGLTAPTGVAAAEVASPSQVQMVIELADEPGARTYARKAKSNRGQAIAEARQQIAKIKKAQAGVEATLKQIDPSSRVLYRTQKALNAITVTVDFDKVAQIKKIAGVRDVYPLVMHERTNSSSVPFLGIPASFWSGAGLDAAGENVRVGVIDTGIDYLHRNFGGPGTTADYAANDPAVVEAGTFPTAKVVGGWDFVGNTYPTTAAAPDADPLDCRTQPANVANPSNGHGSHVAGSVAGLGVNADNTTYTGAYDETTNFSGMKIGPGVAPKAKLYALKVFGCAGSTGFAPAAIEWSMDPNDDDDLSDHLDVINLSLGSSFGSARDSSSIAADNAALAGVIVVASAGNSDDTFFITGSPGMAGRAISVAASVDEGVTGGKLTINSPVVRNMVVGSALFGPQSFSTTGDVVLAVDPDGTGDAANDACSPLTNGAALAGRIALINRGGTTPTNGSCGFKLKVKHAQDAGAIGVIITNATASAQTMVNMADDATITTPITIPAQLVLIADGNAIKSYLSGGAVNATLFRGAAGDTVASFSSRGPGRGGFLKPDISAPGLNITSTKVGDDTIGGDSTLTISGTSMASPHVAGFMALLREVHPTWTVEELKALAMNTAKNDLFVFPGQGLPQYGPSRIGAGRIDGPDAASSEVIAYNATDSGLISVSFGTPAVSAPTTLTKDVTVSNKGTTTATYNTSYVSVVDLPGASVSVSPSSVTVGGGATATVTVTLTLDPASLKHAREASVATSQAGFGRQYQSEEGGYVVLTPTAGGTQLRVPVHAAPRAASTMTGSSLAVGSVTSGTAALSLSGTPVNTGVSLPVDVVSVVSGFELQAIDADEPTSTGIANHADVKYVGVTSNAAGTIYYFAIATHGKWFTPNEVTFRVHLDMNQDGTYDYTVFNSSVANGTNASDAYATAVRAFTATGGTLSRFLNAFTGDQIDTALINSDVMILPISASSLNFTGDTLPAFNYRVETLSRDQVGFVDSVPAMTWSHAAQGVNFPDGFSAGPLFDDLPATSINVAFDTTNFTANGSLGALLLHHHNGDGARAEVVRFASIAVADNYGTPEEVTLNVAAPGVLSNDGAVAGTTITASLVTNVTNGTLTLNADGSFVYVPNPNFFGVDSFTYSATDGTTASAPTTVTITVTNFNDIPVAVDDNYVTTTAATLTVAAPGVLSNDTDADGNTLTTQLVSAPATGTLTLNVDGSFTYVPSGSVETVTFRYRVFDGSITSNVATATIVVSAAVPTVTSFSPNNGSHLGGTVVTITGTNFVPGATVTVGTATPVATTFNSSTSLTFTTPARAAGTFSLVVVNNSATATASAPAAWFADFLDVQDVPNKHIFHDFVESIFRSGVTSGCAGGNFCVDDIIPNEQMAVFLLRSKNGFTYLPPGGRTPFDDVTSGPFKPWIEELRFLGVTVGCGGNNYCPSAPVTRGNMAPLLLKMLEGGSYVPSSPYAGMFGDVPESDPRALYIEELSRRGITAGCGNGSNYCINNTLTRGEMAVFLKATFALP